MAVPLGMVTGVGGGMMRDILLAEIPTVPRAGAGGHWQPAAPSPHRNNNRWCAPLLWATSDGHSL